ncbi:uncharacterized protein [Ptychodera flava]|uniref:uncharacterized protein isoform X1 n=2 Tax=Ptychodera flava TaxID=63121 RepID=UPI00396A18F4
MIFCSGLHDIQTDVMALRLGKIRLLFLLGSLIVAFMLGFFVASRPTAWSKVPASNVISLADYNRRREDEKGNARHPSHTPMKIFLDCGANIASTVRMFRETYPDADQFVMHSFEIDERLKPYFAPYKDDPNHILHCPVAVSNKTGQVKIFLESSWYPGKTQNRQDMQWGGGAMDGAAGDSGMRQRFARTKEIAIPSVDLSQWVQQNTKKEDYVIFKLDVEGAEWEILEKMLKDGTFAWIDKYYGEFHGFAKYYTKKQQQDIRQRLKEAGVKPMDWSAEYLQYGDFDSLPEHIPVIPPNTPGVAGKPIRFCNKNGTQTQISLAIEAGMNTFTFQQVMQTIEAYPKKIEMTVFVYGDFAQQYPDLVKYWAEKYEVGIRGDSPQPGHFWQRRNKDELRRDIVSSGMRLQEIGLQPRFFLPPGYNPELEAIVAKRHFRMIEPVFSIPPRNDSVFTNDNYFKHKTVYRTPRALRMIHEAFQKSEGGILSLDTDFADTYMIVGFLLDYLHESSPHRLVSLIECLS